MASSVLPFLAWSFLPDLVTRHTQTILYTTFHRAGTPHPAPGSPQHTRHQRRIHLTILLLYFAYTLYEAHWELVRQPTLYDVLGLPPNAPEKTISSRYRRLSLQHHPDKMGQGEAYDDASFVILTTARDVLLDPVKRFAYERYGMDALGWQHLHTMRDYVDFGLRHSVAPYYLGWSVILAIFQWLGWGSNSAFWRWWTLVALAAFEIACVTRQGYPQEWAIDALPVPAVVREALSAFGVQWASVLGLKPYLPFQTVSYLRRASLTFFVGLSRVGPLLSQMAASRQAGVAGEGNEEVKTMRLLQHLEQIIQGQVTEAGRLLSLGGAPFAPSTEDSLVQADGGRGPGMEQLKRGVRDWLVRNTVRSDANVQRAYRRAVTRRNGGRVEEIEDEAEMDGDAAAKKEL